MQATARLWGVQDVAEYLGVPIKTLYQWRQHGYGPKGRRVGRHLRYDPDDVRDWFTQLDTTSEGVRVGTTITAGRHRR